jgi:hypothetical protein
MLKMLGPMMEKVIGQWKKLHNGKLHNLCSLPDIFRVTISRRMKWAGHATCERNAYEVLVEPYRKRSKM